MNNKVIKSFLLRHTKGPISSKGNRLYEEDFYINQQAPTNTDRCFLHCFAYGETIWRDKYKFTRPHNAFNNYKYGDENWSFELITTGEAILFCDNIKHVAKPQDVILMRPGKQVSVQTGACGFMQKKTVIMKSPLVKYICENGGLAGINYIHSRDSKRLENIFYRIKQIILTQEKFWQQEISNECYAFLCELNRMAKPQHYPIALHKALEIIDSNPYDFYNLESICSQCKVSVSTMSRLFKKHLKISPVNYIIERRLEQAKRLLSISDMTLKEVADKCGYQSQSFLSRAFKKKFGLSPSQFRQKR